MYLKFDVAGGDIVYVNDLETAVSFKITGNALYPTDDGGHESAVILQIVGSGGVVNEFAFYETDFTIREKINEMNDIMKKIIYKDEYGVCKAFPIKADIHKCRVIGK